MANQKVYQIQINGLTESVKAVDALTDSLQFLDKKIKELESRSVSVSTSNKSGDKIKSLSQEDALLKQIQQTEQKIADARREDYQRLLAEKDTLKDITEEQKKRAAAERLSANNYDNTMAGMKQQLADVKTLRNYTEVTSDEFDKLGQKALELTNNLKKFEEETGQFGRNVGNYKSAADGFEKLKINVAGTVHEFDNAKQAAKTLKAELATLQFKKDQGMFLSDEELKRFEVLPDKVKQIESSIKDAGVPMDALMDSMQSFVAMAQTTKGFSAFFGLDNDEIERSIQKLVALQNAMTGLQTIQKQMQSQEGLGKVFAQGNKSIDEFVAKVTKAKIGVDGLEKSTKLGTAGVKLFSAALKGLASIGVLAAITALIALLEEGFEKLKDWVKGDADLVSAEDALTAAIEQQNKVLNDNVELIQKRLDAGEITKEQAKVETEEAYAKAIAETNKRLLEREDAYRKVGIQQPGKTDLYLGNAIGDTGVTSFGGFKEGIKGIEDFNKRWDLLSTAVANGTAALNKWNYTASDTKDDFVHMSKLAGGDLLNAFNKLADGTREGTKALVDYINHMDELTNGRYSQAIKVGIDKGYLDEQFKMAWNQYENLKNNIYRDPVLVRLEVQADAQNFLKSLDPNGDLKERIAKWKNELAENVKSGGKNLSTAAVATLNEAITKGENKIKEGEKKINASVTKAYNSRKKLVTDAERELANLRISNMKEGLNKTLTQLEENRRQELAKVKTNGIQVEALSKEINIKYDNEILDAKKKWSDEVLQVYSNMWDNIYSLTMYNARMTADAAITEIDNTFEQIKNAADIDLNKKYSDYSINTNNISKKAQKATGIIPDTNYNEKQLKEYIGLLEEIDLAEKYYNKASIERGGVYAEQFKKIVDKKKAKLQEWLDENKLTEGELKASSEYQLLSDRNYTTSLAKQYEIRMADRNAYYTKIEKAAKDNATNVLRTEKELLAKEIEFEKKRAESEFIARNKEYDENELKEINGIVSDELRKRLGIEGTYEEDKLAIQKKYEELRKKSEEEYKKQINNIDKTFNTENERLELNHQNEIKNIVANSHNQRIQEYRDYISRLQKVQTSTPITDDAGWGVVRTSETRRQYRDALEGYKKLANDIIQEKSKLQTSLKNNEISFDDFQQAQRELNILQESVSEATNAILNNLKTFLIPGVDNTFGQLMQSINTYIQAGLQAVQTVMQSLNELQDYENEKEQETLNKENEDLEKALEKQEDIVKKHKDAIDDIEDELANSRGDRRQHLIDQLNAEMEAQRRAYEEQKKIEHDKQVNEKKQEDLEKKKRQQEYKRNLMSILVSNAMAVANGLATQPFVPVGIAMGALAAALGAVQYALAAKQKPYATGGQLDGGQIVGNRHRDGGVKVLGGRAEVEGGEYITNRLTTAKNLDLLEYVNSKKKRIDISDMLEFYNGGRVKTSIQKVRTKFEDGGYIAPLPDTIDIKEQLQNIVVNQDNRPIYVSVVDINNKQADVRRVQTLAGLSE